MINMARVLHAHNTGDPSLNLKTRSAEFSNRVSTYGNVARSTSTEGKHCSEKEPYRAGRENKWRSLAFATTMRCHISLDHTNLPYDRK